MTFHSAGPQRARPSTVHGARSSSSGVGGLSLSLLFLLAAHTAHKRLARATSFSLTSPRIAHSYPSYPHGRGITDFSVALLLLLLFSSSASALNPTPNPQRIKNVDSTSTEQLWYVNGNRKTHKAPITKSRGREIILRADLIFQSAGT